MLDFCSNVLILIYMSKIYSISAFAERVNVSPSTLRRWDTSGEFKAKRRASGHRKASTVAAEDLTAPMAGKKFGKNMNLRLASWTKGVIAESLESVTKRRSATLVIVNPAYTSQMDSRNGLLLGKRSGDSFHCYDGVVLQADVNAARNVRNRLYDSEIDRWTPYTKVKSILVERTERQRLGLLNPDSSCTGSPVSTESELPSAQKCASFWEQWHKIVVWGKQADFAAEYLTKGRLVLVEGKLQTRKWQNKDGQDQYTTEIVAQRVSPLDKKPENMQHPSQPASPPKPWGDVFDVHAMTDNPAPF